MADLITDQERKNPKIINISRKNRIDKGFALAICDVNKLLRKFLEIQETMRKIAIFDKKVVNFRSMLIQNGYKDVLLWK